MLVHFFKILLFIDVTAPVITLNGDNPTFVEQGKVYTEVGATASDDVDGFFPANTVTVGGDTVDTSTEGVSFFVTYDVTDATNNVATLVIRTVTITAGKYK